MGGEREGGERERGGRGRESERGRERRGKGKLLTMDSGGPFSSHTYHTS